MARTMAELIADWEATGGLCGRGLNPVWSRLNRTLTAALEQTGPVQVEDCVYLATWDDWHFTVAKFSIAGIRPAAQVPVPDPS